MVDIQSILFSCGVVHLRFRFDSFIGSSTKTIFRNGSTAWIKHIRHGGAHKAPASGPIAKGCELGVTPGTA